MTEVLADGPEDAAATLLLAHGAGAPMDSPFMDQIAGLVAAHGLRVLRFEFPYMAARRTSRRRRPPPRAETLCDDFRAVAAEAAQPGRRLVVGGKSMGGRVAAMIAGKSQSPTGVHGVVCLGYPFHPIGKPDNLRLAPLQDLSVPALVCQGERDPFGNRAEVEAYRLVDQVRVYWLADGDHDLKPRRATGLTAMDNLRSAASSVARFARDL